MCEHQSGLPPSCLQATGHTSTGDGESSKEEDGAAASFFSEDMAAKVRGPGDLQNALFPRERCVQTSVGKRMVKRSLEEQRQTEGQVLNFFLVFFSALCLSQDLLVVSSAGAQSSPEFRSGEYDSKGADYEVEWPEVSCFFLLHVRKLRNVPLSWLFPLQRCMPDVERGACHLLYERAAPLCVRGLPNRRVWRAHRALFAAAGAQTTNRTRSAQRLSGGRSFGCSSSLRRQVHVRAACSTGFLGKGSLVRVRHERSFTRHYMRPVLLTVGLQQCAFP
jgi:hypothetical protein